MPFIDIDSTMPCNIRKKRDDKGRGQAVGQQKRNKQLLVKRNKAKHQ